MSNPLVPEEKEVNYRESLPHDIRSIVEEYILKYKPYLNHFLYIGGDIFIYDGLEVKSNSVDLHFRYSQDTGVFNVRTPKFKKGVLGWQEQDAKPFFESYLVKMRLGRTQFMELKGKLKELEVDLVIPHTKYTL